MLKWKVSKTGRILHFRQKLLLLLGLSVVCGTSVGDPLNEWALATVQGAGINQQDDGLEQAIYAKTFRVRPNHANIYIYWNPQSDFNGNTAIAVDSKDLGLVRQRSFIFLEVRPGKHSIYGDNLDHRLSINADAGKNYFISTALTGTRLDKHTEFDLSDEAEGKAEVIQSTLINDPTKVPELEPAHTQVRRSMHK